LVVEEERVLRDRELVLGLDRVVDFALDDRDVDVLLLREPVGEDVRVAMLARLGQRHSSHRDHTMRVAGQPADW